LGRHVENQREVGDEPQAALVAGIMLVRPLVLITFLIGLAGTPARGAGFQAGAARVDITPEVPVWLQGYGDRNHPAESVLWPLYGKALAIRSSDGTRTVIVTVDLVGMPGALCDAVAARIGKQYGLARGSLLFNSSHTHTGPVIRPNMIGVFNLGPEDAERVRHYSAQLEDKLVGVITAALTHMAPASLTFASSEAHFAVNRRQPTAQGVVIGVNPAGPVDPFVPVIAVYAADGKLLAVLFGYACHNTTLTATTYQVSGDYAGFAQADLEAAHPGAVALFMQLCGGNQNPNPRGKIEQAKAYGKQLADAVDAALAGKGIPLRGPIRTAYETIQLNFAPQSREVFEAELKNPNAARRARAAAMLAHPERSLQFPVQAIRFDSNLILFALGGEDMVEYALRAKREFPGKVVVAGYSNDVMAYIPTRQIIAEGGYEPVDSMAAYGHPGPFADDVEERILVAMHQVADRVGTR
jgi:neutral ceramidase